jgi:ribosomal protein S27AE
MSRKRDLRINWQKFSACPRCGCEWFMEAFKLREAPLVPASELKSYPASEDDGGRGDVGRNFVNGLNQQIGGYSCLRCHVVLWENASGGFTIDQTAMRPTCGQVETGAE